MNFSQIRNIIVVAAFSIFFISCGKNESLLKKVQSEIKKVDKSQVQKIQQEATKQGQKLMGDFKK